MFNKSTELGTTSKKKKNLLNGHCPFSSDPPPPSPKRVRWSVFFGGQKQRFKWVGFEGGGGGGVVTGGGVVVTLREDIKC